LGIIFIIIVWDSWYGLNSKCWCRRRNSIKERLNVHRCKGSSFFLLRRRGGVTPLYTVSMTGH